MLILLVDDDHAFRSAVSKILQKEGFKVIEAGNGIEAYNIVSAVGANIDLLLTDLAMPRMDGLELAQLVADLYPDMPVMFMTDGVLTAQRLRSGYVVLHKPIRWRILAEAIRNTDVLQRAQSKQAELSLFLFNPVVHAGASDVTARRIC